MDPLCYVCFVFVFVILSCLFLPGWERADLLTFSCVKFSYVLSLSHVVSWEGLVLDCIET